MMGRRFMSPTVWLRPRPPIGTMPRLRPPRALPGRTCPSAVLRPPRPGGRLAADRTPARGRGGGTRGADGRCGILVGAKRPTAAPRLLDEVRRRADAGLCAFAL